MSSLPDVLPEIDYVVLAAPLTDETRGMIDAKALAAMKPTARLVNVGRGPLVVQDDLVEALSAGPARGRRAGRVRRRAAAGGVAAVAPAERDRLAAHVR